MFETNQINTYNVNESIVFFKTKENFGGLSNMASGFPLNVNGIPIRTSEALYQACRFPHLPDVQRKIISEKSPMTAKMRGKPFRKETRTDWDVVRIKIMRWCLHVKLAQNWQKFGELLLSTGDMQIVEKVVNRKDIWGANKMDNGTFVGVNMLGRLLTELREKLKNNEISSTVHPLNINSFFLFDYPIRLIESCDNTSLINEPASCSKSFFIKS